MSNNKQSSIKWLEQMVDNMIMNGGSEDLLAVIEHIQKAKAMHKDEIKQAIMFGDCRGNNETYLSSEQYYNETFNNK